MKKPSMTGTLAALALALALAGVTAAHAAPAASVQIEVNFLLGYVEGSRCEFQRNGSWYTAPQAQAHLRDKFNYLAARNLIDSTEQFIEKAATESSLTGRAYMVRCDGGPAIPSRQWLSEELLRMRLPH
jgi:hypothetical protein